MKTCSLEECPPGLFLFGDTLGFKSEYMSEMQSGEWKCDAYVVDSGEYFAGGAKSVQERAALQVVPLEFSADKMAARPLDPSEY